MDNDGDAKTVLEALGVYYEDGKLYKGVSSAEFCRGCAFEHQISCNGRPCGKGILVEVANDDTGR